MQGRKSKQETGSRNWRRSHGWMLLLACSFMTWSAYFLIHTTVFTPDQSMTPLTVNWPFHINPKPRKFPQDSRTEAFSGLHTLFSDNYSFCQIEGKKTARADWKYLSPCNKKLWMTFTKLLKATMFLHLCKNSNECEHFIFLSHVDQSVAAFPTLITLLGWNKNPSAH